MNRILEPTPTLAPTARGTPIPASKALDAGNGVAAGYPGSKGANGVWHTIIGQMPPHDLYVEPFFGSGQIFWKKKRAASSIVIDRVPELLARVGEEAGVNAICGDALKILPVLIPLLGPEALLYCDPPYLLHTRGNRSYYEHELTDADHEALLELLTRAACRVMISGYASDLYGAALQNWRRLDYTTRTRGKTVTESLWCNFPEPVQLHDWRYSGRNHRERLYLKRLSTRWLGKLNRMNERKRSFLLSMISQSQIWRDWYRNAGTSEDCRRRAPNPAPINNLPASHNSASPSAH